MGDFLSVSSKQNDLSNATTSSFLR